MRAIYAAGVQALRKSNAYLELALFSAGAGRVEMAKAYSRVARECWFEAEAAAFDLGPEWPLKLEEMFDGE